MQSRRCISIRCFRRCQNWELKSNTATKRKCKHWTKLLTKLCPPFSWWKHTANAMTSLLNSLRGFHVIKAAAHLGTIRGNQKSENDFTRFLGVGGLRFLQHSSFFGKPMLFGVETVSFPVSFPFVSCFRARGVILETKLRAD